MTVARDVLERAGHVELASLIVQHYFQDGETVGIASDCEKCGALQGNFHMHGEALMRVVDADGLDGLDALATGGRDRRRVERSRGR
ncbi:hypothetical protein [Nocardia mexicana]|uniref:Uncharacterized protein n=1 Tax=Nocardia mexicana TaxID=279262 RepID=A0A370GXZ9_9NOCA|nr:hypothetical protein [Nocardia mexicana]RDI48522.1 hypothetical protein DFR68_108355 [Nocardia mexicana]